MRAAREATAAGARPSPIAPATCSPSIRPRRSTSSSARSSPITSTDDQVVTFIRWMEAHARRGWFIGDLHRHWLPYYGFGVLAWIARWHRFVLSDGRISIARSLRAGRLAPADCAPPGLAEARRRDHLASAVPALRRATLPGPVIIGGGPAGAAAAIVLARAGRDVTLIERNAAPPTRCAAISSAPRRSRRSQRSGCRSVRIGAVTITTVRLVHGNRAATARLPFPALGLSRRALDEALLRQATAERRHGAARPSRRDDRDTDQRTLRIDCGSLGRVAADTVFLATGKHELRGAARTERGTGLVGMKMYYALGPRQRDGAARPRRADPVRRRLCRPAACGSRIGRCLCVLVPAARLRAADGQWDSLLDALIDECPHLRERLAGARPLLDRPLAIAGLPYGYMPCPDARRSGRAVPPRRSGGGDRLAHRRRRGAGAGERIAGGAHLARRAATPRTITAPGRRPVASDAPRIADPSLVPDAPAAQPLVAAVVPACRPGVMRLAAADASTRRIRPFDA